MSWEDYKDREDRIGKPASTFDCIAYIISFVLVVFSLAFLLGEVTGLTDLAINSI